MSLFDPKWVTRKITSASSFAASRTVTEWPANAHDMAAEIPARPAPTMMICNRTISTVLRTRASSALDNN